MIEAIVSSQSEQVLDAQEVSIFDRIDSLLEGLLLRENQLDHGYATLGLLLTEVSEKELWRGAGFTSFDKYLTSLIDKYHRGRTQIWNYFSSVREMKPYLTEGQMNTMGISKLNVLKRATKQLGFPPNDTVIKAALDPETTVSEVRRAIAQEHRLTPEEAKGVWYDLPGFMVSDEEKLVIDGAFEAAFRTDPAISKGIKHELRIKEGLLRMAMEFLAVHGDAAEDGVA